MIQLMDSTFRPDSLAEQERKRARVAKVDAFAYKLDQMADWKTWHAVLGIRLKGLRHFGTIQYLTWYFMYLFVCHSCWVILVFPYGSTQLCQPHLQVEDLWASCGFV